ncbi:kinase-like protein [Trichocladium antarcticum]|uniref:Kinase-like protein n=1 Tax=Trichocladium antarcticum TaxID=1450529 RepID=A0AAN6UV25_9PEZI|nr:kinase-like protein [Trichocladium antarcticum]
MSDSLPSLAPRHFDFSNSTEIYRYGDRKVDRIGEEYILKRVPLQTNSERATHCFVQDCGASIPVPFVYAEWASDSGSRGPQHHLLMGRIAGKTVGKAWPDLSPRLRHHAAQQVVTYMERLSEFRSDRLESISHRRLPINCFIPKHNRARTHLAGRWRTDDEIWTHEFLPALRVERADRDTIALVQRTMPPCAGQLVFTHGDLFNNNVMIHAPTGEVTGVIDWESAGFWPAWFQYARIAVGCTPADGEWKATLSELMRDRIPHADHGRVWWCAVQEVLHEPGSRLARAWLALLVRYLSGENVDLGRYKDVDVGAPSSSLSTVSTRLNAYGGMGDAGYYSSALGRN